MDHAEVRDQLEMAAVEPGGLERLVAGGDPDSAALVAHVAHCEPCRGELGALRQSVTAIRDAVQLTPAADLRARALEYVTRVGRPRAPAVRVADAPAVGAVPPRRWSSLARAPAFAAGVAAVTLVAAVALGGVVSSRLGDVDAALAEQRATMAGLTRVTDWTLRLGIDPDATGVRLEAPDGGAQAGTVLLSTASNELVMVASGLPAPVEGEEYRCWVESDGSRVPIGAMYRAGELSYWVGEVGQAVGADEDQTFGVSLVATASDGVDGYVVLVGYAQSMRAP